MRIAFTLLQRYSSSLSRLRPVGSPALRTTARLRGVSAVDGQVAWASGTGGTVLRTVDGGETWDRRLVPDADGLDFRDIEAFDERRRTSCQLVKEAVADLQDDRRRSDLGAPAYQPRPQGLSRRPGILGRRPRARPGRPGGRKVRHPGDRRRGQDAGTGSHLTECRRRLPGEGAFAASGTCLVVSRATETPGSEPAAGRVFRSNDRGRTWTVHTTPIQPGNS